MARRMRELDDFMRERIKGTKCLGDTKWWIGNINKHLTEMVYGSVNFLFRVELLCEFHVPCYPIYVVGVLLR